MSSYSEGAYRSVLETDMERVRTLRESLANIMGKHKQEDKHNSPKGFKGVQELLKKSNDEDNTLYNKKSVEGAVKKGFVRDPRRKLAVEPLEDQTTLVEISNVKLRVPDNSKTGALDIVNNNVEITNVRRVSSAKLKRLLGDPLPLYGTENTIEADKALENQTESSLNNNSFTKSGFLKKRRNSSGMGRFLYNDYSTIVSRRDSGESSNETSSREDKPVDNVKLYTQELINRLSLHSGSKYGQLRRDDEEMKNILDDTVRKDHQIASKFNSVSKSLRRKLDDNDHIQESLQHRRSLNINYDNAFIFLNNTRLVLTSLTNCIVWMLSWLARLMFNKYFAGILLWAAFLFVGILVSLMRDEDEEYQRYMDYYYFY